MGRPGEYDTPENSDEESGEAFTDGDFGDTDDDVIEAAAEVKSSVPLNETVNMNVKNADVTNGNDNSFNGADGQPKVNGLKNGHSSDFENHTNGDHMTEIRRDSHGDQNPSIVGILGDQQNHAEQRLAARRAARAEAREIRMRELERQQREQENNADKAYDMYSETAIRRGGGRLAALSPAALHSPRRSSEDSDDTFSIKDLRHELKEVEEKFRKAMILNAQLDNDKAALGYQLELLKDRIEELHEEYQQLQREHKEKCSAHERLKREHASLERELTAARDAVRARDAAVMAAGYAFVEAGDTRPEGDTRGAGAVRGDRGDEPVGFGSVPALALVSHQSEQLLQEAGEGTLDVRLQNLVSAKQALESELRKLKLQLNEERAARQNGVANHHDHELETELEALRKSTAEAKARAARAEAEAALQAAGAARLEAQLARLRARQDHQDEHEEQLKQERRRLQREEVEVEEVVDFWAVIKGDS
ncbi:leucine-rich repeat flightless-interacting protein 2 isoform X2 [Pectinophora gossypiella]|uniref:leucine-rich repeat flightless-interacting protein 2 isoform X2 n=1 Tax=Pectinophora gossypiella TaxID=13191 RepID=UPI00214E8534|nr:leucine-rich repeat flightless-interacting protein 2 isoform X2 [Pectinophora gossypiella]